MTQSRKKIVKFVLPVKTLCVAPVLWETIPLATGIQWMPIAANVDKFGVKIVFIFVTTAPIKGIVPMCIAEHAVQPNFKAYIVDTIVGLIVKSTA